MQDQYTNFAKPKTTMFALNTPLRYAPFQLLNFIPISRGNEMQMDLYTVDAKGKQTLIANNLSGKLLRQVIKQYMKQEPTIGLIIQPCVISWGVYRSRSWANPDIQETNATRLIETNFQG